MERPLTILSKVLAIGLATQLSGKTPSAMEDLSDHVITGHRMMLERSTNRSIKRNTWSAGIAAPD
jgi:hypothetical protein